MSEGDFPETLRQRLLHSRDDLSTANLRTRILDFRGSDSGRTLLLRGGLPRSVGNFRDRLPAGAVQVAPYGRTSIYRVTASVKGSNWHVDATYPSIGTPRSVE